MDEEITTIQKNHTLELVDLPKRKDLVRLKWTMFKEDGTIQGYNARMVAKDFSQQAVVEHETFEPVVV